MASDIRGAGGMDARIAATEADLSATQADVRALSNGLRDIVAAIDKIRVDMAHGFQDVHARINQAQKTPWSVIIGSMALILSIVGMIGGVLVGWVKTDATRLDEGFGRIAQITFDREFDRGKIAERIEHNTRGITDLDTQLRDAMKMASDTTRAEVSRADARLSALVAAFGEQASQRHNALSELLVTMQGQIAGATAGVAAHGERLSAMAELIGRIERQRDKDYADLQALAAQIRAP